MLNDAQKLVAQTYGGGDYAHVETLDECRDVGDTLFTFLMIELSDGEDCTDMTEAARRVSSARDQLAELVVRMGQPVPYRGRLYTREEVIDGMSIIEEMVDPVLGDADQPWRDYRDQNGIYELRHLAVDLIPAANAAWDKTQKAYERAYENRRQIAAQIKAGKQAHLPLEPRDPGSFDYDFLPFWLRQAVDWSSPNGPRVRGTTVSRARVGAGLT